MAILDDLESVLGAEAVAKLKASPMASKVTRAGELLDFYTEGTTPPPTDATTRNDSHTADLDLSSVEKLLDRKFADLPKTIDDRVNAIVEKRGNELVTSAVVSALRSSDELNRIYMRETAETGKQFDSMAFNNFVEEQKKTGKSYKNLMEAYEDMTKDRRIEQTVKTKVDEGVREALKARADSSIPGVTPASARSPLGVLMNRGRTTDGENKTAVQRAASNLEARMSRHANDGE